MALVSIVTPSFNQSAYLEEAMKSVLEQDYPNLEYIVMDGGSTDGSLDIIKKYSSRLAFWSSEPDRGQADAINKGMAHARGEIVAWLNSDDVYLFHTVKSAVEAFRIHPRAVMVYGNMYAVNEDGQTFNNLIYDQLTLADLLCFQIIGQPAVFMRREAFEKAGGLDPTFHFLLDHQLWIKIAQQGEIVHISQAWAAARYHPEAKNRLKAAEFGREAFRILDWAKSQPELAAVFSGVERRARASAHRVDARYLLDSGQPWPALKAWMRALLIYPPTALARMNLLVSALLNLSGLGRLREAYLRGRKNRLSS
ncbi:MAG TPA: glycosyltransferase family 2 protein [Anaerolineales bacterium]|jgi:glycosyltransferase involved in cell wall biosynthesis|nr:glycosyltransferase family 2 protein [Anaerolineales bacterium]